MRSVLAWSVKTECRDNSVISWQPILNKCSEAIFSFRLQATTKNRLPCENDWFTSTISIYHSHTICSFFSFVSFSSYMLFSLVYSYQVWHIFSLELHQLQDHPATKWHSLNSRSCADSWNLFYISTMCICNICFFHTMMLWLQSMFKRRTTINYKRFDMCILMSVNKYKWFANGFAVEKEMI